MKNIPFAAVGLIVFLLSPFVEAEEITLEQAVKTWSFLEGRWTLTQPDGTEVDVYVHLAPTKSAYISESEQGLHIFGWEPKSKRLEVESFLPGGTRAHGLYDRISDSQVSGTGGKLIAPDGTEQILGTGTFTIVDKDTQHFTIGDSKWISKRKQGR